MKNRIVLASNNSKKIRELGAILAASDIHIQPQSDFGIGEVAETGTTFIENDYEIGRASCRERV